MEGRGGGPPSSACAPVKGSTLVCGTQIPSPSWYKQVRDWWLGEGKRQIQEVELRMAGSSRPAPCLQLWGPTRDLRVQHVFVPPLLSLDSFPRPQSHFTLLLVLKASEASSVKRGDRMGPSVLSHQPVYPLSLLKSNFPLVALKSGRVMSAIKSPSEESTPPSFYLIRDVHNHQWAAAGLTVSATSQGSRRPTRTLSGGGLLRSGR